VGCTIVQDLSREGSDIKPMIYETKMVLVLRRALAPWQLANVAAFLAGGLAATEAHLKGEAYIGASRRELRPAIYIEEMFATTNDADNRAASAAAPVDALNLVGMGVHGSRKIIDKITNGLKFLA
jgi:hypothetical protein